MNERAEELKAHMVAKHTKWAGDEEQITQSLFEAANDALRHGEYWTEADEEENLEVNHEWLHTDEAIKYDEYPVDDDHESYDLGV